VCHKLVCRWRFVWPNPMHWCFGWQTICTSPGWRGFEWRLADPKWRCLGLPPQGWPPQVDASNRTAVSIQTTPDEFLRLQKETMELKKEVEEFRGEKRELKRLTKDMKLQSESKQSVRDVQDVRKRISSFSVPAWGGVFPVVGFNHACNSSSQSLNGTCPTGSHVGGALMFIILFCRIFGSSGGIRPAP